MNKEHWLAIFSGDFLDARDEGKDFDGVPIVFLFTSLVNWRALPVFHLLGKSV